MGGQYIGDMHGFKCKLFVTDTAIEMHQAGKIGGDNILSAGSQRMGQFLVGHTNGDGFKFYGEAAAKTTAGFCIIHLNQFKPSYLA